MWHTALTKLTVISKATTSNNSIQSNDSTGIPKRHRWGRGVGGGGGGADVLMSLKVGGGPAPPEFAEDRAELSELEGDPPTPT